MAFDLYYYSTNPHRQQTFFVRIDENDFLEFLQEANSYLKRISNLEENEKNEFIIRVSLYHLEDIIKTVNISFSCLHHNETTIRLFLSDADLTILERISRFVDTKSKIIQQAKRAYEKKLGYECTKNINLVTIYSQHKLSNHE